MSGARLCACWSSRSSARMRRLRQRGAADEPRMPLALLVRQTFDGFNEGANKLDAWNRIVSVELLLLDRVRSAFLGRWFGPRVPLHGLNLRIALQNLDDLRARYLEVARSIVPSADGLNLTEPLMGVAGQIVGSLLSPSGVLAARLVALRRAPRAVPPIANAPAG